MSADEPHQFHYFAYGSNMLVQRLTAPKRCPSAKPVGLARADGYRIEFSKLSRKDGSGKATLRPDPTHSQPGMLYMVDTQDRDRLDAEEGLGKGYDRFDDFPVRDPATGLITNATTYLAPITDPALAPFDWYLALVIAGGRQNGFPAEVLKTLAATEFIVDRDTSRSSRIDAVAALAAAGMALEDLL